MNLRQLHKSIITHFMRFSSSVANIYRKRYLLSKHHLRIVPFASKSIARFGLFYAASGGLFLMASYRDHQISARSLFHRPTQIDVLLLEGGRS